MSVVDIEYQYIYNIFHKLINHLGGYYGVNVYVPLKLICWNPKSQCDGIRRLALGKQLGHEGRTFMSGSNALIKVTPESFLVYFTI